MGGFEDETGGPFTCDQDNGWEIKLNLLRSYLDGNDLVMFENNQAQSTNPAFIFLWIRRALSPPMATPRMTGATT